MYFQCFILYTIIHSAFAGQRNGNDFYRVCYYVHDGRLDPSAIDTSLCTHVIYGFAKVDNNTLLPEHPDDIQIYEQVVALKKKEPNMTILISTSGWPSLPAILKSDSNRTIFVQNAFGFLAKYSFDGLDFDWEFPYFDYKEYFVLLLKDLYNKRSELFPKGGGPLITAAVSASLTIIAASYDIPQIAKYIDFINIMCYDYNFYREYFPFTGYNSPLFMRNDEKIFFNTWNIDWSANYWTELGMPKEKIIVGLPTYGHTFKLYFHNIHNVHSLARDIGVYDGYINYPQVCDFIHKGWTRVMDNESKVPYVYNDYDWISFEDVESMTYKANWIVEQNFRGAMTWNLNADDWYGACNGTKFPLHKVIRNILNHH